MKSYAISSQSWDGLYLLTMMNDKLQSNPSTSTQSLHWFVSHTFTGHITSSAGPVLL